MLPSVPATKPCPAESRSGGRWSLAVAPGLLLAAAAAVTLNSTFTRRLLGQGPWPAFFDLMQVTYTAGCPGPIVVGASSCDPAGRVYNYPPVWAWAFRALGLGADSTVWVGVTLVAAAVAVLGWGAAALRGRLSPQAMVVVAAVGVSPPMLLLVGRGNTDLVVCVLVVAAVACTCVSGRVAAPAVLLGLAAGLKLFPVGALAGLRPTLRGWLAAAAAAAVGVVVLSLPWLAAIRSGTPASPSSSFGAGVLPAAFSSLTTPVGPEQQILGVAATLLLSGFLVAARRTRNLFRPLASQLRDDPLGSIARTGLGLFAVSYLSTTSFDYRLWPLTLVVAGVLALPGEPLPVSRWVVGLGMACCWLTYPLRGLQWVGDIACAGLAVLACVVLALSFSTTLAAVRGRAS